MPDKRKMAVKAPHLWLKTKCIGNYFDHKYVGRCLLYSNNFPEDLFSVPFHKVFLAFYFRVLTFLAMLYNAKCIKDGVRLKRVRWDHINDAIATLRFDAPRLKQARWDNKVEGLGVDNFYRVFDIFENYYDTILDFFANRTTNANAESFNANVKAFKSQFRGVTDIPFFLYRLMKLYA